MRTIYFVLFCCLPLFINAQIIFTVAGNGATVYNGDGRWAVNSALNKPGSVVIDKAGDLYIADTYNNRVRKVDTSGIMTIIAGNGFNSFSGDSGLAINASLYPAALALDKFGNLYIADAENNVVWKIDTNGFIVVVAGTGFGAGSFVGGYSGNGGSAITAQLSNPTGVAVDQHGNIYICDEDNDVIRKVDTSGIISTVVGTGGQGFTGDGGLATACEIYDPSGISVDAVGNLYISDLSNSRIRKVDTAGIITTIAGNGTQGHNGDGGPATAAEIYPGGNTVFINGSLFIAEPGNNTIRRVDSTGVISTIAGTGAVGFSGDRGPANAALLNSPTGIAFDRFGNLFIADKNNDRIREVVYDAVDVHHVGVPEIGTHNVVDIYPNPIVSALHVSNVPGNMGFKLLDAVGTVMQQGVLCPGNNTIAVEDLLPGMYLFEMNNADGITSVQKLLKR